MEMGWFAPSMFLSVHLNCVGPHAGTQSSSRVHSGAALGNSLGGIWLQPFPKHTGEATSLHGYPATPPAGDGALHTVLSGDEPPGAPLGLKV